MFVAMSLPTCPIVWMTVQCQGEPYDKSIQMMQTDSHAKIIFNSITAAQAGTYTIVLRNKSGEDSASGRIKVLDR